MAHAYAGQRSGLTIDLDVMITTDHHGALVTASGGRLGFVKKAAMEID
jgi:hypothetical protein